MQEWHGARDTVIRDKARTMVYHKPEMAEVQEEMLATTGRYQWNKDPRFKEATMSEEGEDIWQDLQGDPRDGDRRQNSRIFHQDLKNVC
jgi:hypothetical protein